VLHGYINVSTDLGIINHHAENLIREHRGISIHQPNPLDPLDLRQAPEECWQFSFSCTVNTIICRILRDEDQLLHTALSESSRLGEHLIHRPAHMPAADQWYRTKRARMIAALGNLEVRIMPWRRENTLAKEITFQISIKLSEKPLLIIDSEERINLREFIRQLIGIPLRKTTHHVYFLQRPI